METIYLCPEKEVRCKCCHEAHEEALAALKRKLRELLCRKECACILASTYTLGNRQETVIMFDDRSSKMQIRRIAKRPGEISEQDLIALLEKPMKPSSCLYTLRAETFPKSQR